MPNARTGSFGLKQITSFVRSQEELLPLKKAPINHVTPTEYGLQASIRCTQSSRPYSSRPQLLINSRGLAGSAEISKAQQVQWLLVRRKQKKESRITSYSPFVWTQFLWWRTWLISHLR